MDRRAFLTWAVALTATTSTRGISSLSPVLGRTDGFPWGGTGTSHTKLERIGLELYAVRNTMRTDPEGTLAAIREIGYTDVELLWSFGNFGRSVTQTRDALRAAGLQASSAHMGPETMLRDWETRLDEAKELGHEYLVVPSLPPDANKTLTGWREWARNFNRAGETARRKGIWLAFHNEPGHQRTIDGIIPFELFLRETDPELVRIQLDVGNMLMGGGDPLAFLKAHTDRCFSFHLKNVIQDRSKDTELANGSYNLGVFLAAVPDINSKPCFVEQEGSADELKSARENFEYLKALDF